MDNSLGQRIGEIIIIVLLPLIIALMLLVALVVFTEVAAVYLSWGIVSRLGGVRKKPSSQPAC